jgi:ATP-dependent DNA helicase RecG
MPRLAAARAIPGCAIRPASFANLGRICGVTVDNIREEHYSRNRRVMGVLKTLRFVEEYGEGMDRIFGELEARLMSPPLIADTAASVTVTLYARSLLSPEDQAWLALLGHLPVTPKERRALVQIVMRSGASGLEARGRQRQRLLDEIRRQGSLSTVEAAEVLGEGLLHARHLLNDLARAGQVVARGRTRARRYYLPELAPAEERQ